MIITLDLQCSKLASPSNKIYEMLANILAIS